MNPIFVYGNNPHDHPSFSNDLQLSVNNFQQTVFSRDNQHQLETKIYVGQLSLEVTQNDLIQAFRQYCQIKQIKIVKGNTQGKFARYCYAFLNIQGNQTFSNDVIRKVQQKYSNWRINIRADYEKIQNKLRTEFQNNYRKFSNPNRNFIHTLNVNNRAFAPYNSQQKGSKIHKILVRQIWLGGIPQGIDQKAMRQVMGYFGMIENLEILKKYAFVKYKLVNDATTAFEQAIRIHEQFGKHSGFRIFFSDPQKRNNIVSNHDEFDKQSEYLPILFLGFPYMTTSFVDEIHIKSICERYGPIIDTYIRKSNKPHTRSYILFRYDNIKSALKIKRQLTKRRELLGDKRVQIALLLSEQPILKARNLQITIEKFQSNNNFEKKITLQNNHPNYSNYNSIQTHFNHYIQYSIYPPFNIIAPIPIQNQTNHINYMNQMQTNPQMMEYLPIIKNSIRNLEYCDSLERAQAKSTYNWSKVCNKQQKSDKYMKQQQVNWSGYISRNKNMKVEVNGCWKTQYLNFDQNVINITYSIKLQDLKFKHNNTMIVSPYIDTQIFQEYINYFKTKQCAGIAVTYKQIILILPKCNHTNQIVNINQKQMLIIIEDIAFYHEFGHKFNKLDDN